MLTSSESNPIEVANVHRNGVAQERNPAVPSIEVKNLSKYFSATENPIFSDISFQVPVGQSLALIGSNGVGKSTLLRCCLRLVEPDSGLVRLDGKSITDVKGSVLRQTRRCAGFVFQKHQLVPRLSALSNVIHGHLAHRHGPQFWFQGAAPKACREKAYHCLELVGLPHLAKRRCDQLSGGQSQRIAIARALMQDPKILFADEPTASLDPHSGNEVMDLFQRLAEKMRLTLVFVSHDLEQALAYSDRVIGLKGGGISIDAASHQETASSLRRLFHH